MLEGGGVISMLELVLEEVVLLVELIGVGGLLVLVYLVSQSEISERVVIWLMVNLVFFVFIYFSGIC